MDVATWPRAVLVIVAIGLFLCALGGLQLLLGPVLRVTSILVLAIVGFVLGVIGTVVSAIVIGGLYLLVIGGGMFALLLALVLMFFAFVYDLITNSFKKKRAAP